MDSKKVKNTFENIIYNKSYIYICFTILNHSMLVQIKKTTPGWVLLKRIHVFIGPNSESLTKIKVRKTQTCALNFYRHFICAIF